MDNNKKRMLLDNLILNIDCFVVKQFPENPNIWRIFIKNQKFVDSEIMECLLIFYNKYEDIHNLTREGKYDVAIKRLNKVKKLKNKFEFDEISDDLFKIMTYPNIAYLQYKIGNIKSAKNFTRRCINIIKKKQFYSDSFLLFRLIQQEINYLTLYYENKETKKGINHSLECIIDAYNILDSYCNKKDNVSFNRDILIIYNININVLLEVLCKKLKENKEFIFYSWNINWEKMQLVSDLIINHSKDNQWIQNN